MLSKSWWTYLILDALNSFEYVPGGGGIVCTNTQLLHIPGIGKCAEVFLLFLISEVLHLGIGGNHLVQFHQRMAFTSLKS